MGITYFIVQGLIKSIIRNITDPDGVLDSIPNNAIQLRDGSYLVDRAGNYIVLR